MDINPAAAAAAVSKDKPSKEGIRSVGEISESESHEEEDDGEERSTTIIEMEDLDAERGEVTCIVYSQAEGRTVPVTSTAAERAMTKSSSIQVDEECL